MKKNKFILITCLSLVLLLNACQAARDGLTGKKTDNTDEFLVQKKNPLILPPDYNYLPLPKSALNDQEKLNESSNSDDIKKLIEAGTEEVSTSKNSSSDQTLENSILKTLNEN